MKESNKIAMGQPKHVSALNTEKKLIIKKGLPCKEDFCPECRIKNVS